MQGFALVGPEQLARCRPCWATAFFLYCPIEHWTSFSHPVVFSSILTCHLSPYRSSIVIAQDNTWVHWDFNPINTRIKIQTGIWNSRLAGFFIQSTWNVWTSPIHCSRTVKNIDFRNHDLPTIADMMSVKREVKDYVLNSLFTLTSACDNLVEKFRAQAALLAQRKFTCRSPSTPTRASARRSDASVSFRPRWGAGWYANDTPGLIRSNVAPHPTESAPANTFQESDSPDFWIWIFDNEIHVQCVS